VRELKRTFEIPEAHFCQLRGLAGILGHKGFMDRLIVRFALGIRARGSLASEARSEP